MKTIYISGKISEQPFGEVKIKFQKAQDFLENLGFEAVNPTKNGLTESHTQHQQIVRNVELLLPCDAIYMFNGWQNSVGACIEYDIATRTGKDVLFETQILEKQSTIFSIQNAIYEATGMKFDEYITKSRKRDGFFARMIFTYHCKQHGLKPVQHISRDRTIVYYYMNRYHDEMKFNPHFRELAQKVDNILAMELRV